MFKSRIELLTVVFIFALSSISTVQAADRIDLKLDLVPGTHYICTMQTNQSVTQTVDGFDHTMNQEMTIRWNYDVIGKDGQGNYDIKLTYSGIKSKQSMEERTVEYDSDNPPAYLDPSMKSSEAMIGSELELKISTSGKTVAINGADSLVAEMIAALALPSSPRNDAFIKDLSDKFGAKALTQSMDQITSYIPIKPVRVGDSWKSETTMNFGFPMRIVSEYSLVSVEDSVVIVHDSSNVITNPDDNKVITGELSMAYDITGTQTGSIEIDKITGLPIRSQLDLNSNGDVTVSGMQGKEPQKWPQKISGTVIVTFENVE